MSAINNAVENARRGEGTIHPNHLVAWLGSQPRAQPGIEAKRWFDSRLLSEHHPHRAVLFHSRAARRAVLQMAFYLAALFRIRAPIHKRDQQFSKSVRSS